MFSWLQVADLWVFAGEFVLMQLVHMAIPDKEGKSCP